MTEKQTEGMRLQICDYEGSTYRTDFWEGQDREYEDLAERIALRKLLPPDGDLLMEVGAGFGRLANLYDGYINVPLIVPQPLLSLAEHGFGIVQQDHLFVAAVQVSQAAETSSDFHQEVTVG